MKFSVYIRILLLLTVFLILPIAVNADTYYVSDPSLCPTDAYSQSCTDGKKACGITSSNGLKCYDTASLNPPAFTANVYSGTVTTSGGYMLNCYGYDSVVPYCDNSGNFVCQQSTSCNSLAKVTICTANEWAESTCGDCKSGYHDCNTNGSCNDTGEHDGVACTTSSGLPGSYSNCVCVGSILKLGSDSVASSNAGTNVSQAGSSAALFVNGTNVGIGTSTPSTFFSVTGTTGEIINVNGGRIMGLNDVPVNDDEAVSLKYLLDNYTSAATTTLNSLWSGTKDGNIWNGTSGTGNVGIGTTEPRSGLDVGDNDIYIGNHPTTRKLIFGSESNYFTRGEIHTTQSNLGLYNDYSTGYITLNTNNVERLRINSDGNIGVGTTTPVYKLDINGNARITYGNKLYLSTPNTNAYIEGSSNDTFKFYGFWGQDFYDYTGLSISIRSGNVGISTTTPSAKLSIDGDTGEVINVNGGRIMGLNDTPVNDDEAVPLSYLENNYSQSENNLWSGTKDGNIWNGTSGTGNVGIGTTDPQAKLTIIDGAAPSSSGSLSKTFILSSDDYPQLQAASYVNKATLLAGNSSEFNFVFGGAIPTAYIGAYLEDTSYNTAIRFKTYNGSVTEKMRITSTGNVGIGTTNPGQKLEVNGTTLLDDTLYLKTNGLWTWNASGLVMRATSGNGLSLESNGTVGNGMYINTSGNVGIGTTSPSAPLTIQKTYTVGDYDFITDFKEENAIYGFLMGTKTDTAKGVISARGSNQDLLLRTISNGNIYFDAGASGFTDGTADMTIKYDGNVGIGITSPTAKLHVNGTSLFTDLATFDQPVTVATPVLASHAATKNYVDSVIASTTEALGVSSISLTDNTYNGSISYTGGFVGYDAANKICNDFDTGSHFCRTDEIIYLIQENGALGFTAINSDNAWIADGPPGFTGAVSADDCAGWTDGSATKLGHFWMYNSSGGGRGSLSSCDTLKKITCCK